MRRYGLQEWLRVHIDGLPERQAAREAARRQKSMRPQGRREGAGLFPGPRPWGAGLILEPLDTVARRSTSRRNQQRAKGRA